MIANRIRLVRSGDGPSFSRHRPRRRDAGFCLQGSDHGLDRYGSADRRAGDGQDVTFAGWAAVTGSRPAG
jgi:hypothetical protein